MHYLISNKPDFPIVLYTPSHLDLTYSGDDKEEILRNKLDTEARHTTYQNSSCSTLALSKSALAATDILLTQTPLVQPAEKQ